jgi:tetratricopeptide (TPR) repeat protein
MPNIFQHRQFAVAVTLGIAIGLILLPTAARANQAAARTEPSSETDQQKQLILQAYEKTKSATSLADFEDLVKLCDEARKSGLSASQDTYVKSLLSWSRNRRGELYTEQASAAQSRGQKDQAAALDAKALADFEVAIELDATRWKPWHNRGVSHAIAGKYENAIADFSKVIELNPSYSNAWFNRGEIHFDLGHFDRGLTDYTEAIRLNPKDAGAYTSRAHTLFRLNRYRDALADYTKALELAPDATALANRGDAYQSLGEWAKAAEDFNQALQQDAESPRALQCAAWLLATCPDDLIRNQKYAVEAAEKAIELIGEPDMRYLDTLAAAYANAGRFEDAIPKIKEAIAHAQPDDAASLKKRLELYQQQKPYRQPNQPNTTAPTNTQPKPAAPTRQASGKR